MLSAYMSACACSHSSFPARPCFLARYRAIVFDWASTRPSTSKMGTWPKGVAIWMKDDNQPGMCWIFKTNTQIIEWSIAELTGLDSGPFAMGETDVLEFHSGLAENQSGQFGTPLTWILEVMQLVNGHYYWSSTKWKLDDDDDCDADCVCVCVRRTETLYMLLMAAPAKLRNWICAKWQRDIRIDWGCAIRTQFCPAPASVFACVPFSQMWHLFNRSTRVVQVTYFNRLSKANINNFQVIATHRKKKTISRTRTHSKTQPATDVW